MIAEMQTAPVAEVIAAFNEVRGMDARLAVIVAGGRIERAIDSMIGSIEFPANRTPNALSARIRAIREADLIDRPLARFLESFRIVRNEVCHRPTTRQAIRQGEVFHQIANMHAIARFGCELPSVVQNFDDALFAVCIVGTVAVESSFVDENGDPLPKSFSLIADLDLGGMFQ